MIFWKKKNEYLFFEADPNSVGRWRHTHKEINRKRRSKIQKKMSESSELEETTGELELLRKQV